MTLRRGALNQRLCATPVIGIVAWSDILRKTTVRFSEGTLSLLLAASISSTAFSAIFNHYCVCQSSVAAIHQSLQPFPIFCNVHVTQCRVN
jgi:hypothetical protein